MVGQHPTTSNDIQQHPTTSNDIQHHPTTGDPGYMPDDRMDSMGRRPGHKGYQPRLRSHQAMLECSLVTPMDERDIHGNLPGEVPEGCHWMGWDAV